MLSTTLHAKTTRNSSWKNVSDTVLAFHDLHMEITNACLETLSSAHWHAASSVLCSMRHSLLLSCLLAFDFHLGARVLLHFSNLWHLQLCMKKGHHPRFSFNDSA